MNTTSEYVDMRRNSLVLRDDGNYSLASSEMNPVIFEELLDRLFEEELPHVVWEPFAGRSEHSKLIDYAIENRARLISQTLSPRDSRVIAADSICVGPGEPLGGVLFHPPYFGSAPLSCDMRDICRVGSKAAFIGNLKAVIIHINEFLVKGGLVAAIGRDYRIRGKRVHLEEWYLEAFDEGYELVEVWKSEPDMVVVFRKTI